MALRLRDKPMWIQFLTDINIPPDVADTYADIFVANHIENAAVRSCPLLCQILVHACWYSEVLFANVITARFRWSIFAPVIKYGDG